MITPQMISFANATNASLVTSNLTNTTNMTITTTTNNTTNNTTRVISDMVTLPSCDYLYNQTQYMSSNDTFANFQCELNAGPLEQGSQVFRYVLCV